MLTMHILIKLCSATLSYFKFVPHPEVLPGVSLHFTPFFLSSTLSI